MTEPLDLAELLDAAARGERRAFTLLYSKSSAQLFAVILRILKHRGRAEEVLQEVYLSIWNNAGSYSLQKGAAMAWMIAIARHRAIDAYRQERRRPHGDEAPLPENLVEPGPGPLEQAQSREEAQGLWRCLQRLEAGPRESILLAYREGHTQDEIATILNSPLGTVKSWIRRGQIHLKACLEE